MFFRSNKGIGLGVALLGAFLALVPAAAQARRTGDLFADADWCCGNRPAVPSDARRGADVFKKLPLTYNRNADLFDSLRPRAYATRADMLAPRRQAFPVGRLFENDVSQMFQGH